MDSIISFYECNAFEAHVRISNVNSVDQHRFGLFARSVCAVFVLLSVSCGTSSARTLLQSGHDFHFPLPSSLSSTSAHAEVDLAIQAGKPGGESPELKLAFESTANGQSDTPSILRVEETVNEIPDHTLSEANRLPDWSGVWRDTGILFGSQFVAAGIIYMMPESVSNWSSEQKNNIFKKYARNVADPVIDKDQFYINYALHPYWGATYYVRARERGLDKPSSFVYSVLVSAMYEFGVECFFEKPSIQDLIVTPVAGSLLGAFVFEPWRNSIKRKPDLSWYDHAALVFTDPVGVLSVGFEKMFGITPTVTFNYSDSHLRSPSARSARVSQDSRFGATVQFPFN